jgi:hypothetical protein
MLNIANILTTIFIQKENLDPKEINISNVSSGMYRLSIEGNWKLYEENCCRLVTKNQSGSDSIPALIFYL